MAQKETDGDLFDFFSGRFYWCTYGTPVVAGIFDDDDFDGSFDGLVAFGHIVGLFHGDGRVFVALYHKERRTVRFEVVDGTDLTVTRRLVPGTGIRLHDAPDEAIPEVFAVVVIEQLNIFKVTRAVPGDAGYHLVLNASKAGISREGIWRGKEEHLSQMPAGGVTHDVKFHGVDAEAICILGEETHGIFTVGDAIAHGHTTVLFGQPVVYRCDCEAVFDEGGEYFGERAAISGKPTSCRPSSAMGIEDNRAFGGASGCRVIEVEFEFVFADFFVGDIEFSFTAGFEVLFGTGSRLCGRLEESPQACQGQEE